MVPCNPKAVPANTGSMPTSVRCNTSWLVTMVAPITAALPPKTINQKLDVLSASTARQLSTERNTFETFFAAPPNSSASALPPSTNCPTSLGLSFTTNKEINEAVREPIAIAAQICCQIPVESMYMDAGIAHREPSPPALRNIPNASERL